MLNSTNQDTANVYKYDGTFPANEDQPKEEKCCYKCGITKMVDECYASKRDGSQTACVPCGNQASADRRNTLKGRCSTLWSNAKVHCKRSQEAGRDMQIDIVPADILGMWFQQGGLCALTGEPMRYDAPANHDDLMSLDRKFSDGHYDLANIQLTLNLINKLKGTAANTEFNQFCVTASMQRHIMARANDNDA